MSDLVPNVNILVLNYNNVRDTTQCLSSLFLLNYTSFSITVIDNCSTDDSLNKIYEFLSDSGFTEDVSAYDKLHSQVIRTYVRKDRQIDKVFNIRIIESSYNGGYAYGNNLGISLSLQDKSCQYVWILNNDTVVSENSLNNLINSFKGCNCSTGIVGSLIVDFDNSDRIQAIQGRYNPYFGCVRNVGQGKSVSKFHLENEQIEVQDGLHYPIGASMVVSRSFIQSVGLLCEDYFLYFEELDWILRGKKFGYEYKISMETKIFHKEGSSTGAGKGRDKSLISDISFIRSRLLFTKKFFPNSLPLIYFLHTGIILNRIFRKQFNRIPYIIRCLVSPEKKIFS